MLGTRHLAAIVNAASTGRAKVVCIGDDHQLLAVDAGGLFTALADRLPTIELTDNRRQLDPAEQAALLDLRHGRVDAALGRLERYGNVTLADNADVLRATLVRDWYAATSAGKHALMAAPTRADVADLNERARDHLRADHLLGQVVAEINGLELRVGDKVIAHRNRYDLGILNGDTGRVTYADDNQVHVTLDDKRRQRIPTS